jgi:hypothetical protein
VLAKTRPVSMPTRLAPMMLCCVARICLPSTLKRKNRNSTPVSAAATAMVRICCGPMMPPKTDTAGPLIAGGNV